MDEQHVCGAEIAAIAEPSRQRWLMTALCVARLLLVLGLLLALVIIGGVVARVFRPLRGAQTARAERGNEARRETNEP
jgi:hypothetical protein